MKSYSSQPLELFYCCAPKDRTLRDELDKHLAGLRRSDRITTWHDGKINPGTPREPEIEAHLESAHVILLLVSPDFLASDYCWNEMTHALERHRLNKAHVIPVLLRPVAWSLTPFRILRVLPLDACPVTSWQNRDEALEDVAKGIGQVVDELLSPGLAPSGMRVPLVSRKWPPQAIFNHCQKLAKRVGKRPGLEYFIQEEARLLPLDASPYEDGAIKGKRENLLKRMWKSDRLIVLGEPGSGKTVALDRFAWELATADPPIIPIIIPLLEYDGKELLNQIRQDLTSTDELVLRSISETTDFLKSAGIHCSFLLDGLNEVPPERRETVLGEISNLMREFPKHHLVVTSRVQDTSWTRLRQRRRSEWQNYVIQPIEMWQAQEYLKAHSDTKNGNTSWLDLDELSRSVRELATTPLLLWMLKEVWLEARENPQADSKMPENRAALYERFVSRMLRRDDERGLNPNDIGVDDRLTFLQHLALKMHRKQQLVINRAEVMGRADIPTTVLDVALVHGLLIGDQHLRFAPHQTIQEYFAACALKNDITTLSQRVWLLRRLHPGWLRSAKDIWWTETFVQMAGLTSDPDAFVQAVAEQKPWLAWWCVQEGKKVREATETKIGARSVKLIESANVEDRRQAASVLASMQSLRAIDQLARLSTDPDSSIVRMVMPALLTLGQPGQEKFEQAFAASFIRKSVDERYHWGEAIADVDLRPGVGVRPDKIPDLIWCAVPAGKCVIGGDPLANMPLRETEIDVPEFHITKYPITAAQFNTFLQATTNYVVLSSATRPCTHVDWHQAEAFCTRLSEALGFEIRLPTEQEWEKAARWDEERARIYPWGETWNPFCANTKESGLKAKTVVGIFPEGASPYGVLDMCGNVLEWTSTPYDPEHSSPVASTGRYILRGGSWKYDQQLSRAASRFFREATVSNDIIGFRVVTTWLSSR